jgi:hypothetical protein
MTLARSEVAQALQALFDDTLFLLVAEPLLP